MADGIVQFIRLALDRASLKNMEREASEESRIIAGSIARTLQGTGPEGEAILKYILKIRTTFENNLGKIRQTVADGLVDIPKAERQAEKLAAAFSKKLQEGIARLGDKAGMGVGAQLSTMAQALPRARELDMSPRLRQPAPLGMSARELGAAGKDAANAWAANFAPIVHTVLTSDATWDVKAAAIMKLGARVGDAWADGIRSRASLIVTTLPQMWNHANSEVLISLQKNATGYSAWQVKVRAALKMVGDGYDTLKNKMKLVQVPDPEILPGQERARLRKQYKGDNAGLHEEINSRMTLNQLSGTQLTGLGKAAQFFGINVAKAAPQVQGLINKLQDLGVSGTKIGRAMPFWANGMKQFGTSVMGVMQALGLYMSVRQVVDFLKSSVQAAAESQVAWAQLSTTVSDYGKTLSELMPQIQPVFDEQAKMGIGYTQSAKALARLIQITGDSQKSLRALRTVQDIAASGFMTLEQASKQVGRAMLGDLGSISRYGIFLDKNKDVLDQLNQRFGGELAMRAKTLTGSLERMSVAWYETKVAMGNALSDGGKNFEPLIEFVQTLREWVIRNQMAIKMLGSVIGITLGVLAALLFSVVSGFTAIFNAATTLGIGLKTLFVSLPAMADVAAMKTDLIFLKLVRNIAAYFDQLFNTNLAKNFDGMVVKLERASNAAMKRIKHNQEEARGQVRELWFGGEDGEDPRAPDMKANPNTLHIRAREHQRRRTDLSEIRSNVLSGDTDLRERGLKKLLEIETEINKRMEEDKDNEWSMIQLGKDKAIAEKIRSDLEKKTNNQSKADAAYKRRIEQLSAIAREADDKQALEAVRLLNVEHDKLIKKRQNLASAKKIGSDAWIKNEALVKEVEDGITGHLEKQDKLFTDRVKKLADMVDLDVNRAEAVDEINTKMSEQQKAIDDAAAAMVKAVKGSEEYNKAMDDQIRAKQKLVILEGALRNEMELPTQRINELEEDLKVAEKRVAAERELVRMRDALNKTARTGKTASIRNTAKGQADRITNVLGGDQKVDIPQINKDLQAARELMKTTSGRIKAATELAKIQEHISDLLSKQNITAGETLELQRQQAIAARLLHDASEPNLDLWDELKYIFENDLPKMSEAVAGSMADVFDTAFTGILRDSRNLGHALNSIPKGFAKAMLTEINNMAKGKAKENLAWAIEEAAKGFGMAATGNFAGATAAFTSAAQHTAAAAAWGLLGGAAGSLGQSASDAYSNATDFASGDRGGSADNSGRTGPDIYLTIDGVDPSNPRHQRLIGETSREYAERYGGKIVMS